MGFVLLAMNFENEVWIHSLQVSAGSVASFAGCLPPSSIWLVRPKAASFPSLHHLIGRSKAFPFSSLFLASSFWVLQQTGDKSECTAHTVPELSPPSPTVGDNALFLWGVRGLPHAGSRPQCPTRLQWRVQDICHCSSQLRTTTSKTCLVKLYHSPNNLSWLNSWRD